MTPKEAMLAKFDNLDNLKLTTSLLLLQRQVKEWCDAKPNNEKLQEVRDAIVDVTLITNKLQLDRGNYHIAMDQYRSESLRMVERARAADAKVEALEQELSIYKKKEELGL
jgi:hypothetical protein